MSSQFYQCIKTGAHVKIAGEYFLGDLFTFGSGRLLKRAVRSFEPLRPILHAEFESYYDELPAPDWFGQESQHWLLDEPLWFSYEGRELPTEIS
jgi:hypothetical protein